MTRLLNFSEVFLKLNLSTTIKKARVYELNSCNTKFISNSAYGIIRFCSKNALNFVTIKTKKKKLEFVSFAVKNLLLNRVTIALFVVHALARQP